MKNLYIIIGIIVIIALAGFVVYAETKNVSGNAASTNSNANTEPQKVVLSMKDFNYYPNTITVKSGQPVSISLDSSVTGCFRTFTIPAFEVSKTLSTPSDTVVFTPSQKGTFKFQCSMGMGYGTLIVE